MDVKFYLKSFIILLIVGFCTELQAQILIDSLKSKDDYIINKTNYTRGIYKTFLEFKYNSPSITAPFTFDKNNVRLLADSVNQKDKRLRKDDYWGFSDGEKIYVRWNKNYELREKGRYCYFVAHDVNMAIVVVGVVPLPVPAPDTDALIINFNNGKVFEVGKGLLEHILETDDQELLAKYKREKQRSKKVREYIVLYNERNKDKIK